MKDKKTPLESFINEIYLGGETRFGLDGKKYIQFEYNSFEESISKYRKMAKKKKKEIENRKEFTQWFSKLWEESINTPDNHAEDWN